MRNKDAFENIYKYIESKYWKVAILYDIMA